MIRRLFFCRAGIRTRRIFIFTCFFAVSATPHLLTAQDWISEHRTLVIPVLAGDAAPPVIDGDHADSIWRQAAIADGFSKKGTHEKAGEALYHGTDTVVRLLHDNEKLYILFVCRENSPAKIKMASTVQNDPAIYNDDHVTVFLGVLPDTADIGENMLGGFYWSITINPLGTVRAVRNTEGKHTLPLQVAARIHKNERRGPWQHGDHFYYGRSWVVEMAVPLKDLGMGSLTGKTIRANLARVVPVGESSSWNAVYKDFRNPHDSGAWEFAENQWSSAEALSGLRDMLHRSFVRYTFIEDMARIYKRVIFYKGTADLPEHNVFADELDKNLKELHSRLELLEQQYVRVYKKEIRPCGWEHFSTGLPESMDNIQGRIETKLAGISPDALYDWPRPDGELKLDDKGAPNRILFGWWGTVRQEEHYNYMKNAGFLFDYFLGSMIRQPEKEGAPINIRPHPWVIKNNLKTLHHSNILGNQCLLPLPRWWVNKHKDNEEMREWTDEGVLPMETSGWRPQCNLRHPAVKDAVIEKLKVFTDADADKNFAVILMGAEMTMQQAGHWIETGYSPLAISEWRAHLTRKYGSIDILNRRWGTIYTSFDAIQPPPDMQKRTVDTNAGLVYEFEQFRKDTLADWCRLVKENTEIPVAVGPHVFPGLGFNGPVSHGLDTVKIARAVDILEGHDSDMSPTVDVYTYSIAHLLNKRLIGGEWYSTHPEGFDSSVTDENILHNACRRNAWRAAVWGKDMITFWNSSHVGVGHTSEWRRWNNNFFQIDTGQTVLRHFSYAIPLVMKKLTRFSPVLLNTKVDFADGVAVLQPSASSIGAWPQWTVPKEGRKVLEILFDNGYTPLVIPEELLLDGTASLDGFRFMVIPYGINMQEELSDMLFQWVEKGGHIVALGPPGIRDEFGKSTAAGLASSVFTDVAFNYADGKYFGSKDDNEWRWETEKKSISSKVTADAVTKGQGRGKVTVFLENLNIDALTPRLMELVNKAVPLKFVSADSPDAEIVVRKGAGKRYICVLNRNMQEKKTFALTVSLSLDKALDMDAGCAIPVRRESGCTKFSVPLAPGEFTFIQIDEGN